MRRRVLCLAAGILASGLTAAAAEPATDGIADLGSYAARVEIHPFESLTLTDRQFLTGTSEGAQPVTVTGILRIAKVGTERLPTVILMHGSGGLGGNIEFWQRALAARGLSTFALDGFTGRGLTSVNTDQSLLARTNLILDIYRALGVLAKHPRVDPARVAVMGFSRGGQAALYAGLSRFDAAWNRSGITPALYLPVYPDCAIRFRDDTAVVARPIRMFGGGGDDYNPAASCAAYTERLKAAGADVSLTVYPGAQHVFDNPAGPPQPTVAKGAQTVRACAIREEANGVLVAGPNDTPFTYADPCVQRDPHIGSDEAARVAALKSVLDVLNTAFRQH
ncbi:dienelactone hydrolase family protein [Methylobacterium sp. J-048]|uniref:dienelactone hydrolase family protein n=1 Tax=Methylobacterium sp. J-048 TaxID=2836635 RepID=UPI001FB90946|nr:dienelactone hydrolase family protein [Methylobacterium sp. J-048]MCJ2058205.1 dienelactone hydrolase family protein [Methylobacterium sp. J-048]